MSRGETKGMFKDKDETQDWFGGNYQVKFEFKVGKTILGLAYDCSSGVIINRGATNLITGIRDASSFSTWLW